MFEGWSDPLTTEERDALLDKIANMIKKRRLETPAVLFLESHRPLANIGAHAGMAFSPFLVPFLGFDNVRDMTRLLQDRGNVDLLVDRIASEPRPEGELNES